jgi:chaperone modulatory protein CbpM
MMEFNAVITLFPDLATTELVEWIERRWVQPELGEVDIWIFHPVDVARVRLIYDLRRTLDTPVDTVPLILSLLDQVYDLRCSLNSLTQAIATQPAEVQAAVLNAVKTQTDS